MTNIEVARNLRQQLWNAQSISRALSGATDGAKVKGLHDCDIENLSGIICDIIDSVVVGLDVLVPDIDNFDPVEPATADA